MALCSYDEAYTIPSEHAALLSLRTMQILVEEMGLADTVDPLAGSYYVESLTSEMITAARQLIDEVEALGGAAAQRDFRLPRAEGLHLTLYFLGDVERARIGVADIFAGHAHHATREVKRVTTAVEHSAEPVQCRIRGTATHRFVQGADLVVKHVTALVKTAQ